MCDGLGGRDGVPSWNVWMTGGIAFEEPAEFPMVSWFVIGESVGNAALKRVVDCRIDREFLAVMGWGKWG